MAALTGVLTADFTQFRTEVDRSVIKLQEFERAGSGTSKAISGFSEGLGQVDRTLGVLGIHIGPQVQALRELGAAAGKTASEIGLIGTAGLTVGAALAGWQLGRMAADFFNLDDKIANATASLLGFGDVAAQRSGAAMDVLTRATQIAKREITNFDEALKIIKESNLAMAKSVTENADALVKSAKAQKAWADEARPRYEAIRVAQEEVNQATGGWHKTLLTITPALTAAGMEALSLGVAQGTVAKAFNLSEIQVAALDRQMKQNVATMAVTEPALGSLDAWIKTNTADTNAWNTEWRFTSEVIGEAVVPALDEVTAKIEEVSAAQDAFIAKSKNAPGSVGVNTGGISFPLGVESALKNYTARYGGGSAAGAIGGGPPPDFLSWALSMGLAQKAPVQMTNNFNIVDTESEIARRVSEQLSRQIQQGSLVQ